MPGYINAAGKEVRLGRVQSHHLDLCVHTHRPTLDRLFTVTADGQRYREIGRDRA